MKAKAIVKIVLCSLLAIILASVLCGALTYSSFDELLNHLPQISFGSSIYRDEASYTIGSGTVTGSLRRIDVDWTGGNVRIAAYGGNEISVQESVLHQVQDRDWTFTYTGHAGEPEELILAEKTEPEDEDDRLRFRLKDGTLSIHERKSGWHFSRETKMLEILIPYSMVDQLESIQLDIISAGIHLNGISADRLKIDSASSKLQIIDGYFDSVDFDCASGSCKVSGTVIGKFNMDSASGNAELDGSFESIEMDGASGDLILNSNVVPKRIEVDTASGDCMITIPSHAGFVADLDSASGDLNIEGFNGNLRNDIFTCGDGFGDYSFESASGDVTIRAGK